MGLLYFYLFTYLLTKNFIQIFNFSPILEVWGLQPLCRIRFCFFVLQS